MWRTRRTGNHSLGQNSWWWTWQVGWQIEGFGKTPSQHADRGLFQGDTWPHVVEIPIRRLSEEAIEAKAQAEIVGEKILATLNQPYQLGTHEYHSSPSIGATVVKDHQAPINTLLKQADIAMYQSKASGRNTLRFFAPQMLDIAS